ncbi:MAG: DUF1015 domain-containing protein [bacterium]|nr:DUF1015 domain-containing protein [bacterium]
MPEIRPFPGIRYNPERIDDFSSVVAPPYDVIDPSQHAELLKRDPANCVRLILGSTPGKAGNYTDEAAVMKKWIAEGILMQDAGPRYYLIEDSFQVPGEPAPYHRWGIIGRVRVDPFETGRIFPHERTHSGPKEDRLKLMRAFKGNLSQVFTLFDGDAGSVRTALDPVFASAPIMDITDRDGLGRRMWVIDDPAIIDTLSGLLADRNLYIADGHHRYETALTYSRIMAEADPDPHPDKGYNFVMMALVGMQDPGLAILPTHRHLYGFENFDLGKVLERLGANFHLDDVTGKTEQMLRSGTAPATLDGRGFILYDPVADHFIKAILTSESDLAGLMPDLPAPVRILEVTLVERFLMMGCLGMTSDQISHQEHLEYFKDLGDALERARNGGNLLAVMPSTGMDDLVAVTGARERMPQKSTFFYPKLLSGLVFYDHGSVR